MEREPGIVLQQLLVRLWHLEPSVELNPLQLAGQAAASQGSGFKAVQPWEVKSHQRGLHQSKKPIEGFNKQ